MTDDLQERAREEATSASVDVRAEYDAFKIWAGNTFPDQSPPSSASHLFASWMASARHRLAFASPTPEPETIPRDIAEQVLTMGKVEWGATAEFDDAGHLSHLADSLRMTRERFNLEDLPVKMHGLYLTGSETVLCHTGTSPNSGPNAQALAGAWNWLHDQCLASLDAGSASS